jgi:hypothetical protein
LAKGGSRGVFDRRHGKSPKPSFDKGGMGCFKVQTTAAGYGVARLRPV